MAFQDDLRSFLENRLLAYDAGVDLSPGSPAQVQIIDPTVARFAQDPFSTDIPTFIQDVLIQNYPELAADNGGLLGDLFSKPLQLMLEPFKRQIELVKLNQSVNNANLMADEEADALGANFFDSRNEGSFAGGTVRLYFAQPTTQRVTPDKRVFTSGGLNFYPTESYFMTSSQMLFNRQGSRYFMDIVVRAQDAGNEYNVAKGAIIGIEDVAGVVQVTNPVEFIDGAPREDNETYLGSISQALTERSLVTRRGIAARIPELFQSVRALSVVGAGDAGMNRDILTGTSEGFLHIVGKAVAYGDWVFINEVVFKDDGVDDNLVPQAGDRLRFHVTPAGFPAAATFVEEAGIIRVLFSSANTYLLLIDGIIGGGTTVAQGKAAIFKPGYITISGVPGGQNSAVTVPNNQVHLGGHTDIFVRPVADAETNSSLASLTDGDPLLALIDVSIPTIGQNIVSSAALGTASNRPQIGDLLVIETGVGVAGTYKILEVDSPNTASLRVDTIFSAVASGLRARVIRHIHVNLVEPRIPKLPFQTGPISDLSTIVGSTLFTLAVTDSLTYGAAVGDVIRILDGDNAGDYVITEFDIGLGGQGPIVDRQAVATAVGLRYEIFTAQTGLTLPLVRVKSIEVLDSSQQVTGITVPYGDTVDIRPMCDLDGAGREIKTLSKQMLVFPDLKDIWGSTQTTPFGSLLSDVRPTAIATGTDARYTQQLETADGIVRRISAHVSNPINSIEINLPPFLWNGKRDKLLAFTTKTDTEFTIHNIATGGNHQTSDIAEAKIGDTLTLLEGPNQGSYIIKDKRVLDLWGLSEAGHKEITLIQVDPELPSDPFRTAINFIKDTGGTITATELVGLLEWSTDFDNNSGYYVATFLTKLRSQLNSNGFALSATETKTLLDSLIKTGYSVGPAAVGDLRLYFDEPVSCEFYYSGTPTVFTAVTDPSKVFVIDHDLEPAQVFPESEVATPPTKWSRLLDQVLPYFIGNRVGLLGGSLPLKGVLPGDIVEFREALNDLPARPGMSSSWLAITQAGTNIVRLILPEFANLDNAKNITPGMLLFLDSGPDTGAYTVTGIDKHNTGTNPTEIIVRLDRSMTHTTLAYPETASLDINAFSSYPAYTMTFGNAFPMSFVALDALTVGVSADYGATFSLRTHVFTAGSYANIAAVVADITADIPFMAGATFDMLTSGDELIFRSIFSGPSLVTYVTGSAIAIGKLRFLDSEANSGGNGSATLTGTKRIYSSGLPSVLDPVNNNITVYAARGNVGINLPVPTDTADSTDASYLGTFPIIAVGVESTGPYQGLRFLEMDRSAVFPAIDIRVDQPVVHWIRHSSPTTQAAETSGGGREITDQFVRFRLYDNTSIRRSILEIPWGASEHPLESISRQQVVLDGPIVPSYKNYGHKLPFRIIRPGVKRFSSTMMSSQREGALYYVDLPVRGLGPTAEMNISPDVGLRLTGRFTVEGYTLVVKDENFTFSSKEQVDIILPKAVLPVGSTPSPDNYFNLSGQNIQLTYNNAPLIDELQRFFDAPQDRVLVASSLVRHFLPSYVYLDANYIGGESVTSVAKDIIEYLNNIPPDDNFLEANEIVSIIKRNGATSVDLPITLVALTHGTNRKIRGMRSENIIGADDVPTFKGNFNQSYFISGPDTSQETTRPSGEQVFLKRT